MSEKQAKRQRRMEAALEDHGVRLTACEAAINGAYNLSREFEAELQKTALEDVRKALKRARRCARYMERSAWRWKMIAAAAIAALAAVFFGMILL